MKRIDPRLARGSASLGATQWQHFLRVYLPLSLPGVGAGGLMIFMLAVGFYITPALVGGSGDQMVSTFITEYTTATLNWGMAAALAVLLLAMTAAVVGLAVLLVPPLRSRTARSGWSRRGPGPAWWVCSGSSGARGWVRYSILSCPSSCFRRWRGGRGGFPRWWCCRCRLDLVHCY